MAETQNKHCPLMARQFKVHGKAALRAKGGLVRIWMSCAGGTAILGPFKYDVCCEDARVPFLQCGKSMTGCWAEVPSAGFLVVDVLPQTWYILVPESEEDGTSISASKSMVAMLLTGVGALMKFRTCRTCPWKLASSETKPQPLCQPDHNEDLELFLKPVDV